MDIPATARALRTALQFEICRDSANAIGEYYYLSERAAEQIESALRAAQADAPLRAIIY